MEFKKRRGQAGGMGISGLLVLGIGIVVLVIVSAMGAAILDSMNSSINSTTGTTVINNGLSALGSLTGWLGIIVVAAVAAIIIGIILSYFGGMFRQGE